MTTSQASSNETIVVPNATNLLNVNMTNVTKLTASNFLMWSRQVHALLDGYDLAGFIDGSMVTPPPTLTTADVITVNPAYTLWKQQDKLIYIALLGAITVSIQPILSTTTTSAQIRETLSATYAKPSRGHIKQLKQQVKQWTKGNMSIDAYVQGLTTRFDQLAFLGKEMDHKDQIEHILEDLPEEYKQVIDRIKGREVPPSLTEVHEKTTELRSQASVQGPCLLNSTNHCECCQLPGLQQQQRQQLQHSPQLSRKSTTTNIIHKHGNNDNNSPLAMIRMHLVDIRVVARFVAFTAIVQRGVPSFNSRRLRIKPPRTLP